MYIYCFAISSQVAPHGRAGTHCAMTGVDMYLHIDVPVDTDIWACTCIYT